MFVDEIKLKLNAGKGGDGVVRWRHERGKEFSGPSGGNGGWGGNVLIRGIRDVNKLYDYKNSPEMNAEDGEDGGSQSREGKNGEDLIIDLPVGSVVTNAETGEKYELIREDEVVRILSGGKGGYGNEYFKSSRNVTPRESTSGKDGESAEFGIELQLIADVGFIGLPNAGKSSLLNALTNARAKVAAYSFTTLDPNLGEYYGFVLADIPGLIEGSSEGKGLGQKFLRHIKRTKIFVHLVSLENEDLGKVYKTIREELEKFDSELSEREEILVLSKTDLLSKEELEEKKKTLEDIAPDKEISILDDRSIKDLGDYIISRLRNK